MSSFAVLKDRPATEKLVLFELDVGELAPFLTNYQAGTWYINIDLDYPDIDASLLVGAEGLPQTTGVGSVDWDNVPLLSVASPAACVATDGSFHFSMSLRELYIHGINANSPQSHQVVVGITRAYANRGRVFGTVTYEPRVAAVPNVSRQRDPLQYGRLEFGGGSVALRNEDGELDTIGENTFSAGSAARLFVGFDDLALADYRQVYAGHVRELEVGFDEISAELRDRRLRLRRAVPLNSFDTTTYPFLNANNQGKTIPLAYGVIRNAPAVVVNETQGGGPQWVVKLADPVHPIHAVTQVRVNGAVKTPAAVNLTAAEVTLNNADFSPGQTVTVDFTGYKDGGGNPIDNAADVIRDLIEQYFPFTFTATFFDLAEWATATAAAPDIGLFVESATEVIALIEDIANSILGLFIVDDFGRFTLRLFNNPGVSARTISRDEILELSSIRYDATDALTSVQIGYSRDWSARGGEAYKVLTDRSQESALLTQLRVRREDRLDTLLTNAADAQAFATTVLEVQGAVQARVLATLKMSAVDIGIADWVNVQVDRPVRTALGYVFCEVLGISRNLTAFEVALELRIWARIGVPVIAVAVETLVYDDTEANAVHYDDARAYSDVGD